MRSIPAIILFFFIISSLQGQQLNEDSTQVVADTLIVEEDPEEEEKIPVGWSVYFEYLPEYAPHPDQYGFNQQFGFGGSRGWVNAGFFVNYLREGIRKPLIFPNQFDLIFLHSGGYLGALLMNKDPVSISLRYNFSYGTLVWENAETKSDLVRDYFSMSKPELSIQYTLIRVLAAYASIGYKLSHGIQIPGADKNDFNGIAVGVGLRVGFFKSGL